MKHTLKWTQINIRFYVSETQSVSMRWIGVNMSNCIYLWWRWNNLYIIRAWCLFFIADLYTNIRRRHYESRKFLTMPWKSSKQSFVTAHRVLIVVIVVALSPRGYSKQTSHSSSQHDITYRIDEESRTGTTIGNLATNVRLEARYPADVVRQLRFRFLSPAPNFIGIEEATGRLFVAGRIDREAVCRSETDVCRILEDVAVQPVQYFQIIKASIDTFQSAATSEPFWSYLWSETCVNSKHYICAAWRLQYVIPVTILSIK